MRKALLSSQSKSDCLVLKRLTGHHTMISWMFTVNWLDFDCLQLLWTPQWPRRRWSTVLARVRRGCVMQGLSAVVQLVKQAVKLQVACRRNVWWIKSVDRLVGDSCLPSSEGSHNRLLSLGFIRPVIAIGAYLLRWLFELNSGLPNNKFWTSEALIFISSILHCSSLVIKWQHGRFESTSIDASF